MSETPSGPDRSLASGHLQEVRRKVGSMILALPSATGIIRDEQDRVLIVQHANKSWGFPGGAIEPLELPAEAVAREVREETNLVVTPVRLLGVFGGPSHHVVYPNGDEVSYVSSVFECCLVSGEAQADGREITATRWVRVEDLAGAGLSPLAQAVAEHLLLGPSVEGFQTRSVTD